MIKAKVISIPITVKIQFVNMVSHKRLVDFHQIYNFGGVWDKDTVIRFCRQKVKD